MSSQTEFASAVWTPRSQVAMEPPRPFVPKPTPREADPSKESDAKPSHWRQVDRMLNVYNAHGGVLNADQYAFLLGELVSQPISLLARAILNRDIVCIRGRSGLELPLFQFKGYSVACRDSVAEVLALLRPRYTEWEVAQWFATPNPELGGRMPVELARTDDPRILMAARAEFAGSC